MFLLRPTRALKGSETGRFAFSSRRLIGPHISRRLQSHRFESAIKSSSSNITSNEIHLISRTRTWGALCAMFALPFFVFAAFDLNKRMAVHRPLAPGSFRVLALQPPEGSVPGELIRCSLWQVSSFQEEEYEAISYAWGPGTGDKEPIYLNHSQFLIQSNLAAALRSLQYEDRPRILWIDALCINQADPVEKANQVPLMRDIYANARQVIIWLGEEGDSDMKAVDWLNEVASHGFWKNDKVVEDDDDENETVFEWAVLKSKAPVAFEHLVALLKREWFNRTWTIQELASSQTAVVVCGDSSIDWDTFTDIFSKLRHPIFAVDHTVAIQSLQNIDAMERIRRAVNGTTPLSLFDILLATCFNECSDPRDKVFAVLGLAKDWIEKGGLVPDYRSNTSAEDIYRIFAMWDVKKNGMIRVLSCATEEAESTNLPSWAPDWRKIKNAEPFVRFSGDTGFSASSGAAVEAWFSDHGWVLHSFGEIVDCIEVVGSQPRYVTGMSAITNGRIEDLDQTYAWLKECYELAVNEDNDMTEERFEHFWRTMTCGLTETASPAPSEYGRYFREYLDMFFGIDDNPRIDEPYSSTKHLLIEGSLSTWSSRRRFSTTIKGRLACVPQGAQSGDLICVLYGGDVPYILRPHSQWPGYYTVIGECYVDGVMFGEVLSKVNPRKHFRLV